MADRHKSVIFFADGSAKIGMGHVSRSYVLAREMLRRGFRTLVVGSGVQIGSRFAGSYGVVDHVETDSPIAWLKSHLQSNNLPDLVVVDGYHYSAEFFSNLAAANVKYGVIDDNGETVAPNPVFVLNQNPHASPKLYHSFTNEPVWLLGLDYVLLRDEIVQARDLSSSREGFVCVNFGGSDPLGLTGPVAQILGSAGLETRVVEAPTRAEDGGSCVDSESGIVKVSSGSELPNLLATCRVAVLAAGSTLWEADYLGAPTLAVVVADNQMLPAQAAVAEGRVKMLVDARFETATVPEQVLSSLNSLLHNLPRSTANPKPYMGKHKVAKKLATLAS